MGNPIERQVQKVLASREDLLLGQGTKTQTRRGVPTPVTAIDLPWIVTTKEELKLLDTSVIKHCTLADDLGMSFFVYDEDSDVDDDTEKAFIQPVNSSGRWVVVRPTLLIGDPDSGDSELRAPSLENSARHIGMQTYKINSRYCFSWTGTNWAQYDGVIGS